MPISMLFKWSRVRLSDARASTQARSLASAKKTRGAEMTIDAVGASAWIGTFAAIIMLVAASVIAWQNQGSQNLVLAYGAVLGSIILFAVQAYFELQGSTLTEYAAAEYTIDRKAPSIRQWVNPKPTPEIIRWTIPRSFKLQAEAHASDWLASNNPAFLGRYAEGFDQPARDIAIYSVLSFIGTQEFDWQVKKLEYRLSTSTVGQSSPGSSEAECQTISRAEIESELRKTQSVFAGAPLFFFGREKICLPPNSRLTLSRDSLLIQNPVCAILFQVVPLFIVAFNTDPSRPYVADMPMMPDGKTPRFTTVAIAIRIQAEFSKLRAKNRYIDRYRTWTSRVMSDAKEWFAPVPPPEPDEDSANASTKPKPKEMGNK
jgi:hypothetical protein